MTEKQPKTKKINDLEALATLVRSGNYAIPILDLGDRDSDGDPKLKQVPLNLLQSLFKTETNLHKVATTGKYSDLKNLPQLFSGNYADLSGKPSLFSGVYGDLQNKPDLSQFLTQHQDISGKADKSEVQNCLVKTYTNVFSFSNYINEGGYNHSNFPVIENSDFFNDINKFYIGCDAFRPAILSFQIFSGSSYQAIPLSICEQRDHYFTYWRGGNPYPGELTWGYDSETGKSSYTLRLHGDYSNERIATVLTVIYSGRALELLNTVEQ